MSHPMPDDLLDDAAAQARFDQPTADEVAVISLLRSLPAERMPAELSARIAQALPEPAHDSAPVASVTPLRRRPPMWVGLSAAAAAAALLVLAATSLTRPPTTEVVAHGPVLSSGTDYSADALGTGVAQTLAAAGLVQGAAADDTARIAPAEQSLMAGTFTRTTQSIDSCVDGISAAARVSVVAIDLATVRGRPAAVIVTRTPDSNVLDVTAVALNCTSLAPAVIAHSVVRV